MTSTAMATAQQIDVEVDGGTLTAEIRGEGPSVVLVHGSAPAAWG
jgi:hypothetical protein